MLRIFAISIFACLAGVCVSNDAIAQTCVDVDYRSSCWERQNGNSKLIIFVHGIGGSSDFTFHGRTKDGEVTWPGIVSSDGMFGDADILVIDYFSARLGKSESIPDLARGFYEDEIISRAILDSSETGKLRYTDLVFVAHSMGGLIVREALLDQSELARRTHAIFTFATPTGGSQLANWLAHFSESASLNDLTQLFGIHYQLDENGRPEQVQSSFLDTLRDRWLNDEARLMDNIPSYCAFEMLPTRAFGLRSVVVEKRDASFLCNRLVGLWEDHNGTVKPDTDWKGHSLLSTWYSEVFPDRLRHSTNQQKADVIVVPCDTDFYDEGQYTELLGYLSDLQSSLNFRWRYAVSLPHEWRSGLERNIWNANSVEPSVLIIHYSCFLSSRNNWRDRKQDNVAFLESLAGTDIRVVYFSRAFTSVPSEIVKKDNSAGFRWYDEDNLGISDERLKAIRKTYFQSGCRRIYSVPVGIQSREALEKFEASFKSEVSEAISADC